MAVLGNKNEVHKAITLLECVMLLTLTCRNLNTVYRPSHGCYTFKIPPPPFRKENANKKIFQIRMGITIFKILIQVGISSDICSKIKFYGSANALP